MSETESHTYDDLLTFDQHLDIFRKMLFHVLALTIILATVIFCFKHETFELLLAPRNNDFVTFRYIERFMHLFDETFSFEAYDINLISTELSSQFMSHIYVSCVLACLFASPYILYEIFRFVSPALYESEKKYSVRVAVSIYIFFVIGVLMSYFILFPISFRFLGTYQVDPSVTSTITLDSYITTFTTLVFLTGIIFQLPIIIWLLGKMGFLTDSTLKKYRPYALVIIMVIAAMITPPDIFTLALVTLPIYGLYELSIIILDKNKKEITSNNN